MIPSIFIIAAASFVIAVIITKAEIPFLRRKAGQNIREEGLKSHYSKAGTPSMGGISIIIGTGVAALIASVIAASKYGIPMAPILTILLVFLGFGVVGFLDDYLKVIKKQNEGFKVKPKFACQMVIAIAFGVLFRIFSEQGSQVYIPGADVYVDFGIFYVPFIVFAVLAMTNAVNLTDGLDGLASGVTALVAAAFVAAGVMFSAKATGSDVELVPGIMHLVDSFALERVMRTRGSAHNDLATIEMPVSLGIGYTRAPARHRNGAVSILANRNEHLCPLLHQRRRREAAVFAVADNHARAIGQVHAPIAQEGYRLVDGCRISARETYSAFHLLCRRYSLAEQHFEYAVGHPYLAREGNGLLHLRDNLVLGDNGRTQAAGNMKQMAHRVLARTTREVLRVLFGSYHVHIAHRL